jgi:phosphate-selective porin OprO/OprP
MKNQILTLAILVVPSLYSNNSVAESVVSADHDINISNKAGLAVNSGDFYFRINGRLMIDFAAWDDAAFSGVDGESGSGSEIRRARIYLKGKYKDWQYRFQTDFAENKSSNKSSYIKYAGFKNIDIFIGKHTEPFGFENLNSSKYISPIERSASTANFAGDRELGVSIAGKGNNYGYQIGAYDIDSNATDNNYSITGRATFAPINNDGQVLHVGASFSLRQLDENSAFEVKNRAGVHSTSVKSIISESFFAEDSNVYDLELSYTSNQWNIVGEYVSADLSGVTAADNREFSNYYIQTGFFLTDDQRPYNVASGTFGGIKPSSETGAWEVFARFESIDLSDQNLGSESEIFTLGINWFSTKYTRLSLNYVTTDINYASFTNNSAEIDGSAINMRAQFHW